MPSSFIDKPYTVYDQAAITKWKESIVQCDKNIERYCHEVEHIEQIILRNATALHLINERIFSLKNRVQFLGETQGKPNSFARLYNKEFFPIAEVARLKPEIPPLEQNKIQLQQELLHHNNRLEKHKNQLRNQRKEKIILEKQVEKAQEFLLDLDNNPKKLVNQIYKNINSYCDSYNDLHPDNQSNLIRTSMLNLQLLSKTIFQLKTKEKPVENKSYSSKLLSYSKSFFVEEEKPNLSQLTLARKYFLLCGLLDNVIYDLESYNDPNDKEFVVLIKNCLDKTNIGKGDLPGHLAVGERSGDYFHRFYPLIQMHQLSGYEHSQFERATLNFKAELRRLPANHPHFEELNTIGDSIVNKFSRERTKALIYKRPFDIKLAILVLQTSTDLIKNPNPDNQRRYKKLIDKTKCLEDSTYKKIAVGMLAILGIILTVASALVLGYAATFALSGMLKMSFASSCILIAATTLGIFAGTNMTKFGSHCFFGLTNNKARKMEDLLEIEEENVEVPPPRNNIPRAVALA